MSQDINFCGGKKEKKENSRLSLDKPIKIKMKQKPNTKWKGKLRWGD